MKNVPALTRVLERNPGNDIVASMLIDQLQEEQDMEPTEATRHVGTLRKLATDHRDLILGAQLLCDENLARKGKVLTRVRRKAGVLRKRELMVCLKSGTDAPAVVGRSHPEPYFWPVLVVTVGAGWLLTEFPALVKRIRVE